jgi:hydrogenase large subunit
MATKTVFIDPNVRIEGHLRIELETEGNTIVKARSSGTSFRGFENILQGRDPRDAPHITQRICGVCPIPYARAAAESIENAQNITVNNQGRLLRNLILAANFIDSHLLHFYILSLPDFIQGLPTASAQIPASPKPWRGGEALPVSAIAGHFAAMLAARRACHKIESLFGGRMPHVAAMVPGGITATPSAEDIAAAQEALNEIEVMIKEYYYKDVTALIAAFPDYKDLGASHCDFLSYGAFPDESGKLLLPAGFIAAQDLTGTGVPFDQKEIKESVAFSRYQKGQPQHPESGVTIPDLTREDAYSWLKAPRLGGRPCEVGPLARALVAGKGPGYLGVWARHACRQEESTVLVDAMKGWLAELTPKAPACTKYAPSASSTPVSGRGLIEAPRGALGHWVTIASGKIQNYHIVAPTTWNASPRDEAAVAGPMERSLENIKLADSSDPIEATRIVHSFDPCLQCAVH